MSSFLLLHNPKCSKSRQALELLKEKEVSLEVREYLKEPLTSDELHNVMNLLEDDYKEIVRTKEEGYKAKPFSLEDKDIIAENLSKSPKLMERPIVVFNNQKAVVARPTEKLEKLF